MPRRSLLDIASGGQYKTSKDLPEIKEKIMPALEFILGATHVPKGQEPNLLDLAFGLPVVGKVGKVGRGIVKTGVKAVKKLRSIQKLEIQKKTVERLSRHSMSKEGARELKKIGSEIDHYLGPQRSARIVKQGGNVEAPSIRKLDRKKFYNFEERLDALAKKEGGVVKVEYEKGFDLSRPQTAKGFTSKQRIEREKLREEKRLLRELGGSQRGKQKGGSIL